MPDIIIKDWIDLQSKLFEDAWVEDIKRFRSPYAFRGMALNHEKLSTSLMLTGGNYIKMERHILRNFKKYAHRVITQNDSFWNWISLAKHHGLPTRIIDWSFSPYVAMHFMTDNILTYNEDGVIWAVNFKEVHTMLPSELKDILANEGSDVFTIDSLSGALRDFKDFDSLSKDILLLFFEPPSIDERIVNQYALFSVLSKPDFFLDEWLRNHPSVYKKFIIPAGLKWEIRDKLDQANITERVLFPGLDGLSMWLRRLYTTR
ncbi:MAG: FRG domain-containing protein [Ignavibacteriaceae bacterium]